MIAQKQVLIVEDNEINRMMLREILSSEYSVLEAENGQAALDVLKTNRADISLILLDIVMPVMDGYTFLSIIKADAVYSAIPVIVTTQSDRESDEVAALSHGAADFVAKPYKPQVILHRVASIIHLRETAAMVNQFQYDRLTGLYSKEFFYQRVREILLQQPDRSYDIICSDIENFKLINDIFGVPAGDKLLCGVADMYSELVGEEGICGRFNADQFACLLEHQEYTDQLFVQAEAQLNALSNTKSVVVKWGIYPVRDRATSVEQMCDRAFLAAHSIKGQYAKHFAVYDDNLRNKLLREQAITDSMEKALAEKQFFIYLQPKYTIQDDRLAGAESLVRWNHPEWGFMSPAEFIPLFEKNGFITRLDQFVWVETCKVLRRWLDQGYQPIPISVNVSRADVYQADLADILLRLIQKYSLPPSLLHLEITESAYTENPEQIIHTVGNLRELGFIIEMDDFGTGYSSLNMLNKMPLDVLKLDMKFIQSETAKPIDQGILRFIMGLARWMNLSVVAEGVETREQLERLRDIGCDYVQGYYFSKPMPCREFEILAQSLESQSTGRDVREEDRDDCEEDSGVLLIVDEDSEYRRLARETFQCGYRIEEAENAVQAIRCIVKHENRIAGVILSLSLREEGGFAVLEYIQKEKKIWNIPVIVSGPQDALLEEKALIMGADDFISRPYTQKSLWKRLARVRAAAVVRERERRLHSEAYRDYLTGLLNRRGLHVAEEALRREEGPFAVYLFDLDNLKEVNDKLGHAEGDRMIRDFGSLLRAHSRETDILARYGGDEFAVILKRMGSEEAALRKGNEICRAFRDNCGRGKITVTCSAGIVVCRETEMSVEKMLARADEALYKTKSDQKGCCCMWKG
ncbi:EAL domain-containing protein [Cuneatibacter caecimuris]|uniref:Stage 0 sporulation protein A homolog n=1 Tax=Cuneatibacter caecimuris TaxID=1796618 RepID=A0A4Q7PTE6_9FIRM|nr:EAL domain-containing protein [Cuneatibacter caecimuris]RZT02570.1 diguanylate cyclase (GGDEF)-like protein [Cuneatibacter caecimuris]